MLGLVLCPFRHQEIKGRMAKKQVVKPFQESYSGLEQDEDHEGANEQAPGHIPGIVHSNIYPTEGKQQPDHGSQRSYQPIARHPQADDYRSCNRGVPAGETVPGGLVKQDLRIRHCKVRPGARHQGF